MSSSAYQYQSDDGTSYQVILPDDFAAALSYVRALGSEPYLASYISPRYANYRIAGGNVSIGVIVTVPYFAGFPPADIAVGTNIYLLQSSIGEQRSAYLTANALMPPVIQGPAGAAGAVGPAGPAGPSALATYQALQAAAVNLDSATSPLTFASIAAVPAGTYLAIGTIIGVNEPGPTSSGSIQIKNVTASTVLLAGIYAGAASNGGTITVAGIIVLAAASTVALVGVYDTGELETRINDISGTPANPGLYLIKLPT